MGYHDNQGVYHAFRGVVELPLTSFLEATSGDVGNLTAHGGKLASDSTPALSGSGSTVAQQLSWAAGNTDQIVYSCALPDDFDGRDDVIVELLVSSGTTDPATFTVASNWDGAASDVSDTVTDDAKSATAHRITARISAGDIPDSPAFVSVALTPAAHATDAIVLLGARLLYTQKPTS